MTPDQQWQLYKDSGGMMHSVPSPETLRFMEQQIEINEKMEGKLDEIRTSIASILPKIDSIDTQTKKTNGRVNLLENEQKEIRDVQKIMIGIAIIINLIFIPIVVAFLIKKLI